MRIRESARVQDGIPLTFATQQGEVRSKGQLQTCLAMSRPPRSLARKRPQGLVSESGQSLLRVPRCRRYALRLSATAAALGGGNSQERASAHRPSGADQAPSRQRAPAPPGPAAEGAHQRNARERAPRRASPTCRSRTARASSERASAWFGSLGQSSAGQRAG